MGLEFRGSKHYSIGVEIELQIIDPATHDLTSKAEEILEICRQEGIERVKAEIHQSMIEVDSEICMDVKNCQKLLQDRLIKLLRIANSLGLKLSVTGTHPFQKWPERLISNYERYINLHEKFQWLTRRMNIYGMHVHVGVPTGEQALAIANGLAIYLPHLLALSANSPFWQGIDTGMQSSRISILESFPYSGISPRFETWKDLETYYDTLHRVGVIHSLKDLYWYIRPNPTFGTIEFRICDGMSTLRETMAIAALIHCLVIWADQNPKSAVIPKNFSWIIPDNLWSAAREGLSANIVENVEGKKRILSESILEIIDRLKPTAKKLHYEEEFSHLATMLQKGNGALRQRSIYQESESLTKLVSSNIDEFEKGIVI